MIVDQPLILPIDFRQPCHRFSPCSDDKHKNRNARLPSPLRSRPAMDFSSQYQYPGAAPGGQTTYGFLGPMQPLTPSHSASAGSDDFGNTSPPVRFPISELPFPPETNDGVWP